MLSVSGPILPSYGSLPSWLRPLSLTLSATQVSEADDLGKRRQDDAWAKRRAGGNNAPKDYATGLWWHTLGARGEKAYNIWDPERLWYDFREDFFGLPDFHPDIDVKTVEHADDRLIVRPGSRKDWRYLLMDGSAHPTYTLIGWYWGHEAQIDRWWEKRTDPTTGKDRSAWFVDRTALHSMLDWRE